MERQLNRRAWPWLVGWLLHLGVALAGAAEPTGEPLLRLETGMHTASIKSIATDREGRWAVTASHDKTARLWDVATGRPAGVLRPPQDLGDEGKLYAVAMSPDGATVAVGGWTGWDWEGKASIYLFDRATQQLRRRITGLPNVVSHLAWSPDGHWLAASLGGANGVRVFDATSGTEVGRDTDFEDDSYSVEFSPPGSPGGLRLLSTSFDGQIRLHAVEPSGAVRLLRAVRPGGGQQPYAARFSPDGRRVAVGYYDSRVVQVLGAADLSDIARPDVTGVDNGDLSSVAWSADGRSLVAAGRWDVKGKDPLRRWSVGDWRPLGDVPLAENTVMDLVALPARAGGGWLFGGSDPTWGVLGADGQVLRRQDAVLADLRGKGHELQLTADRMQVRFGYVEWATETGRFDLALRAWVSGSEAATPMQPPRWTAPGLKVDDWKNTTQPTLNGQPLKLRPYETSRSLAITPDGQRFVLGADWWLRCFDRLGEPLWEQAVPGVAWAVNLSTDDRWVVAGYGDGTIRWHRMDDGKEVLAFFPHANRQDWVLWTPEGFYAASPGAEGLIGYHVNRGKDREGAFISAAQLRSKFYQPDLVSRRLSPEGERLMADAVQALGDVRTLLAAGQAQPPQVRLVSDAQVVTPDGHVQIAVAVQDGGAGVERLIYRVDGVELQGRPVSVVHGATDTRLFEFAPQVRSVQVSAVDRRGVESPPVQVRIEQRRGAQAAEPPTLHVLAVGISQYRDASLRAGVAHAAADARDIAALFDRQGRRLYGERVKVTVVENDQATAQGIREALHRMAGAVRPWDVFVFFMAGHGRSDRANGYHFVPWDAVYTSLERLLEKSLNEQQLLDLLSRVPALKTVMLLDTCSAGALGGAPGTQLAGRGVGDKDAIDRLSRLSGRHTLAAVGDNGIALEVDGHGAFTFALLEGLSGKADRNGNRAVEVRELADYVEDLLPALTRRRYGVEQFPISKMDGQTFTLVPGR